MSRELDNVDKAIARESSLLTEVNRKLNVLMDITNELSHQKEVINCSLDQLWKQRKQILMGKVKETPRRKKK